MTKIRDLIISFRARRNHHLDRLESVSFENFCNESPSSKYPDVKESSMDDIKLSPAKNCSDEYRRFSSRKVDISSLPRPTLPVILMIIVLLAVFLVLPIIYLMHCFGLIYIQEHNLYSEQNRDQSHYEPSQKIHDLLNKDKFESIINLNISNYNQHNLPKNAEENGDLNHYNQNIHKKTNKHNIKTIILPNPPSPNYNQCKLSNEYERLDCFPESGVNKDSCEARGCCWIPAKTKPKINESINVPYCFYPMDYPTYNYVNITNTAFGLVAYLKREFRTAYPDDVNIIKIMVKYETENRLHVKIMDPLQKRFEPPYPEIPIVDKAAINLQYIFDIDPTKVGFKILRKTDNSTIFNSQDLHNFIFSNQFLQISAQLPSMNIYGLGEHRSNLQLSMNWTRFTFFNHDAVPTFNMNLYGSHPFYLMIEKSKKSHGVFLLNSNAIDIILQPLPAITYRTIGGVLDFYFFLGPTPGDVISQYTELIGRSFMPPYWGLGFHLCRFGYKDLNDTQMVMERNINAGIPLDTQWNDLDYMNNSNDFTYNHVKFKNLPKFINELHERGMHYVPLIDPGVSASEPAGTYPPYDIGVKMDIFVKNSTNGIFIGKVWNKGTTVWPDFTHPNTVEYWTLMLRTMHKDFAFDGAWIDMNEPSNFWSGEKNGCPKTNLESPPYFPGIDGGHMYYKTMCMTAKHYAGLHYNVHNLYGFTEAIVTNFALAEIRGKRPFVISRSSFPGLGHYAGHWSGDVISDWQSMRYTIPQLLNFNMFGIPLMGADICGFNKNTTESLCNRWMQLGAFYPFSRNHNTDNGIPQDPVAMGPLVTQSARKALQIRYSLLPYLYTLFWASHTSGETVARPLFFEFFDDKNTYAIDKQFLWGSALMIIPVLEENTTNVNTYLPSAIWYNFYNKSRLISKGEYFNISAPLNTIPLFIRGGYIIPQQRPEQTTMKSRKNKINLLAAANINGKAFGELYWDDGDSLNSYEEKRYSLIAFEMDKGVLRTNNIYWGSEKPPNLGNVTILGIINKVNEVFVNNIAQAFKYDLIHKYILITNLNISFEKSIVITWK